MQAEPTSDSPEYITRVEIKSFPGGEFTRLTSDLMEGGKPFQIAVHGKSMTPFIYSGDVVTLVPVRGEKIRLGDVVAITSPSDRMIIHRVVCLADKGVQTKGDNGAAVDALVPYSAIIARVAVIIRNGKPVYRGLGHFDGWCIARLSARSLLQPLVKRMLICLNVVRFRRKTQNVQA